MWSNQRFLLLRTEERDVVPPKESAVANRGAEPAVCCQQRRVLCREQRSEPPVCCKHRRALCCEQTSVTAQTGIWPIWLKIGPFSTRIGALWTRIRLQPAWRPGRPSAPILYPTTYLIILILLSLLLSLVLAGRQGQHTRDLCWQHTASGAGRGAQCPTAGPGFAIVLFVALKNT